MSRRGTPLVPFDPDIDRTERRLRARRQEEIEMAEGQGNGHDGLRVDPPLIADHDNVINPPPPAVERTIRDFMEPQGNFEIDPIIGREPQLPFQINPAFLAMLQSRQFGGHPHENAYDHLTWFRRLCSTISIAGWNKEGMMLHLFPFTVRDFASGWLDGMSHGALRTWPELVQRFMTQFFPTSKVIQLRAQITGFRQTEGEGVIQAWGRLKGLLRSCPQHGFQEQEVFRIFYQGLSPTNRQLLNASGGGIFIDKTVTGARAVLEALEKDA